MQTHTLAKTSTPETKKKSGTTPFFQPKLTVNTPGDTHELEADRVADQVMRMQEEEEPVVQRMPLTPISGVQRMCADCEEKQEGKVQRQETTSGAGGGQTAPSVVSQVLSSGGGRPMETGTRQFMESRFGQDFGQVRIHTGGQAAESASAIQAKAYTSGRDIVFGEGAYRPESGEGKRLLAHELVHVGQQGNLKSLQRKPTPGVQDETKEAAILEGEILASSAFKKLKPDTRKLVKDILITIGTKPLGNAKGQRNYYLKKLKIAVTTPTDVVPSASGSYGCSPTMEKENNANVDKAIDFEKRLNFSDDWLNVEERIVNSSRNKTTRGGQGGKKFWVDRSDPRNIRVQIKVKLIGKAESIAKIKKLEDAIERKSGLGSGTRGYTLDIVFVDTTGIDVFEFTVDFCQWPNSGNWASDPTTLSHEVHHALGLDDRYDYIESHADNKSMDVPTRLHWFNEQLKKTSGPRDDFSKMSGSHNPLLSEDVCAVAFDPGPDRDKCIQSRKDLDPSGIPAHP